MKTKCIKNFKLLICFEIFNITVQAKIMYITSKNLYKSLRYIKLVLLILISDKEIIKSPKKYF